MKEEYLDALEKERETVFNSLEKISKSLYMAINRDPECTKEIIRTGRNEIQIIVNFLKNEDNPLQKSPFAGGIKTRLHLLFRLSELPLFKWNLEEITRDYQPSIDRVAVDSHICEIGIGNLFCSVDNLYEIANGKSVRELIREYDRILKENDYRFFKKGSQGSFQCLSINHPGGRAKWIYSLELEATKKYGKPTVLERFATSNDYSLLYGNEGIHLQVKDRIIFRRKEQLRELHLDSISRHSKIYYPAVRELFLEVIPIYSPPAIA